MMKSVAMVLAALPITLVCVLPGEVFQEAKDRERLGAALGIKLVELASADPPGAKGIERVSRATGMEASSLTDGDYYWGLFEKAGEELAVHLVRFPMPGLKPAAAVILALDENDAFAGAAVVNERDEPIAAWRNFSRNLRFSEIPRLPDARPRSQLESIRKRSEQAKTEEGRLTVALLDVLVHMNEQASVFNIPEGTHPLSAKEQVAMMGAEYAKVAELADDLEPLLGEKTTLFAEIGRDSAAVATELARKDGEIGRDAQRKLFTNCRRCHNLPLEGGQLKDVFAQARTRLGIGDGFYQVGHDLRISHADRQAAQRVADTMRAAALLLDAAE